MNKETLKKIKAALLAGTMGLTLSGCSIEIDDDLLEQFGITINSTSEQDVEKQETTTTTTTTIPKETTTETQTTTSTEYVQTFTTATTTTTVPTQTTIETTTTTTTTTTPANESIDLWKIARESYSIIKNEYEIIDGVYEVTVNEENSTLWKIATKYLPSGMTTAEFIENIKTINEKEDNNIKMGEKIKVPARLINYTGRQSINSISSSTGISVEELCALNNLSIEEIVGYSQSDKDRTILVTVLPTGTTSYKTNSGSTIQIFGNTIIKADELIPCENTYSDKAVCAAIIKNEINNTNVCEFVQFMADGTYDSHVIAYNIEKMYTINGIPVFEARNIEKCYELEAESEYVYEYYTTAATAADETAFHFYNNLNGNLCFTFDNTNLNKYGYTKTTENCFKPDEYYAQDETAIDYRKENYGKTR